ncbi:YbaN family protein [Bowmanella denitrificans]|uniref:YbaN family protein n=1 Tax=Bowmanella denitrificans TaxID=366582 RepID=UPI0031E2F816
MQKVDAGRVKMVALKMLGCLFLALGGIGAILPVMPTTIFLILALACFTRSSKKFEQRLLNHHRYGEALRNWQQHRVVPVKAKCFAAIGMSLGLLMMSSIAPMVSVLSVAALMLAVWVYLLYCPSSPPN